MSKEIKTESRRYWIKLEKDFLKSTQIKVIKAMPNGNEYVLFYLALMLESAEFVGHLRFSELVPYNEDMLSAITDVNIDVVRSAMRIFIKIGLIQILEDSTIFMPLVPKMTGKESESAERVRNHRKNKLLHCNIDVTKSNDNKDKDKDKDKQITNKSNNKDNNIQLVIDSFNELHGTTRKVCTSNQKFLQNIYKDLKILIGKEPNKDDFIAFFTKAKDKYNAMTENFHHFGTELSTISRNVEGIYDSKIKDIKQDTSRL